MPIPNIEDVAAGLSDYTKSVLRNAAVTKTGEYWTPYAVSDTTLVRSGTLTPLGIQVRAHLTKEQS